eukprot:gene718-891_t
MPVKIQELVIQTKIRPENGTGDQTALLKTIQHDLVKMESRLVYQNMHTVKDILRGRQEPYSKSDFASPKGEFSASINPANLKIASSVEYERSQGMGSSSMALRYNISPPRVLTFKLLFDNTGVIPDANKNVKEQLDALQNLVYTFQDSISSPYYVRVIWGVIDFKGKLTGLETSYSLFSAEGAPIRAEVDITILEEAEASKTKQAIKKATDNANVATMATVGGAAGAGGALLGAGAGAVATSFASSPTATPNSSPVSNTATTNPAAGDAPGSDQPGTAGSKEGVANEGKGASNEATTNGKDTSANNQVANQDKAANTPDKNNPNKNADAASPTNVKQTQAQDTLPGVANKSLGDPNLSKPLAKLNGLDSLRNLPTGLSLAVPALGAAGLLAMLLALGKKYGSKGVDFLKSKAKAGKDKAVAVKNKVKTIYVSQVIQATQTNAAQNNVHNNTPYVSRANLIYDPAEVVGGEILIEHRVMHVMNHLLRDSTKANHTFFAQGTPASNDIIGFIDHIYNRLSIEYRPPALENVQFQNHFLTSILLISVGDPQNYEVRVDVENDGTRARCNYYITPLARQKYVSLTGYNNQGTCLCGYQLILDYDFNNTTVKVVTFFPIEE